MSGWARPRMLAWTRRRMTGCIGRIGVTALLPTLLAACSAVVDVRSLATGRVDVPAYALRGTDIAAVRREAEKLCPSGGEVVYQASRGQRTVPADGRVKHWLQQATSVLDTPRGEAQMTVICSEMPGNRLLLAAPAANPVAMAAVKPAPASPPPVGPLTIEW